MPVNKRKLKPAQSQNEFVVGGRGFYSGARHNDTADRVEQRLNKEAIDRLRLDAEIEADVNFLFDSVLADGIEVVSRITDEDEAEYGQAQEIAEFVSLAISTQVTQRPIETVVKEMGKAAFYSGVKVGEIVLKYRDDSQIKGKLVLDRINPKPNSATAFVTDKFYNVLGLVGARREGQAVVNTSLNADEIIPREKFLIISFELEDNDPRGLSQARALFGEYCEKFLTKEQWKEWRRTSATPKKVGVTHEGATDIKLKDANGNLLLNPNGTQKTETPQKNMLTALEGFVNNSTVVVPFGADVKQLEVNGTGIQFTNALKYNDSKMRKVIIGDSLVTGEADKDARAARESSKDVSDIRKQTFRTMIANAIEKDIFRLLTTVNFGEDKAHLTPNAFLGDTEATDLATDMQAYTAGGYELADEHYREVDKRLGFDPRGKDWRKDQVDETGKPAENEEQE